MAIFHLHVKNISRGEGRSVVAAAAYRAGATLPNEQEERESAFGGRRDVLHAEIRLPAGAPGWMADRAALWNGVERAEIRKDARLAKEIEVSLPRELARPEWLALVRRFADAYTAEGFAVDFAIHDDGTGHNPHAHLLMTTRVITDAGFGPKIREADGRKFVVDARKLWATIANASFASGGSSVRIDHRSHAEAGVEREPGTHKGPDRQARSLRRSRMSQDGIDKARRDLLSDDRATAERFPLLSARSDWPPSPHMTPTMLSEPEAREFDRYADEMAMREGLAETHRPPEDHELPVPDPNGRPITSAERNRAEDAMIAAMHDERDGDLDWYKNGGDLPNRGKFDEGGPTRGPDPSTADWYRVDDRDDASWPEPGRSRWNR